MGFLQPYYEYDVFASYSHGVRRGETDAPLKDWTLELIRRLETDIRAVDAEFDELHIWRDEQIDPTIHLTDELRAKVQRSGILLIVMSPRYLHSAWCRDELEWFRQQVNDRARDAGRVFVIRALPTDESTWPEFLRDERGHALVGFRLYNSRDSMPFGWHRSEEHKEDHVRQLWLLQTAITRRLRELRATAEQRARSLGSNGAAQANGTRRIYLHARAEHGPVRDEIKKMLSEEGIAPLTPAPDVGRDIADWTRESKVRIEAAKHCDALALVRADDDDRFIGELLEIGVDERERIQSARKAPLPCAVLDRSGQPLRIDVSPFGIERFDLGRSEWRSQFRSWLDNRRGQMTAAL